MSETLRDAHAPTRPEPDDDRFAVLEAELGSLRKLIAKGGPPAPAADDGLPTWTIVTIGLLAGLAIGAMAVIVARPAGVYPPAVRVVSVGTPTAPPTIVPDR